MLRGHRVHLRCVGRAMASPAECLFVICGPHEHPERRELTLPSSGEGSPFLRVAVAGERRSIRWNDLVNTAFIRASGAFPSRPRNMTRVLPGCAQRWRAQGVGACVFTSMHNVAYYSGFLYCSFGPALRAGGDGRRQRHLQRGHRCGSALAAMPWRQHHLYRLAAEQLLAGHSLGHGQWCSHRL